jgi:hypothetical protein
MSSGLEFSWFTFIFGVKKNFYSVGNKSPDWKELFQPIIPQFVAMKENPITIDFSDFTSVPANPPKYKEICAFFINLIVCFCRSEF